MNVALPSTDKFIEKVINEVQAMYTAAGAPLTMFHVGGDEVPEGSWEKSPEVVQLIQKDKNIKSTKDLWTQYFQKLERMLKTRGIAMNGWEELAKGTQTSDNSEKILVNPDFIRDGVQLDAWWSIAGKQDAGYALANAGYKVVLCPFDYFYFDLAHIRSFDEPGDAWIGYLTAQKIFSFNPYNYYGNTTADMQRKTLGKDYFASKEALTPTGKANITGLQAALWEENIGSPKLMEYMLLPRLLAMAARAWEKEPAWANEIDKSTPSDAFLHDWSVFANVLGKKELPRLDLYNGGYNYRIPTPGAVLQDGKIMANCGLPGFTIRYTSDGSTPTAKSPKYVSPVILKGNIKFRAFSSTGRGGAVVTIDNK
jgi:hexosaminidase